MKKRCVMFAVGLCLAAGTGSWAFDTLKTTTEMIPCRVRSIGRLKVEVERGAAGGLTEEIPVNEIVAIFYEDEPKLLKTARNHLMSGRYQEASDVLKNVKLEDTNRPEIRQDIEFYKALCAARLALGGSESIKEAGAKMRDFVTNNSSSYHHLEASEVVGDLMVALGAFAQAQKYYAQVGAAPFPDYKMRAGVLVGRAQLADKQIAEAKKSFQAVLAMPAIDDLAKSQQLAADLGLARCLAAEKQYEQAIKKVKDILGSADAEQAELHARAYNTLGTARRMANQKKEALMAFLHVDVLYYTAPEAHAEALFNLAELWSELNKEERARRARTILRQQYKNSPWTKKLGP